MATPYARTVDGLELQLATNHFGPFLLTGLLLPQLVASGDGRVVAVSSQMHRTARRAPLGDPRQQQGRYSRWPAYGETKLANLLFTFELERRLRGGRPAGAGHRRPPRLLRHPPRRQRPVRPLVGRRRLDPRRGQPGGRASPRRGRLPMLMAATDDLPGGTYCGPGGLGECRGLPQVVGSSRLARDENAQRRLWSSASRRPASPTPDRPRVRPQPDAWW